MLVMLGGLVVWVDPFSTHHKPLEHLAYPIGYSERYQNDGISRNFTLHGANRDIHDGEF